MAKFIIRAVERFFINIIKDLEARPMFMVKGTHIDKIKTSRT